jgi:hypothetical protein
MNIRQNIKRILKEEIENTESERLKYAVKKMINFLTKDIEFPENFYDFMVDIRNVKFLNSDERVLVITTVMKKPFNDEQTDQMFEIRKKFKPQLEAFFKSSFDRIYSGGTSTLEVYLRDKERDNQIPNF